MLIVTSPQIAMGIEDPDVRRLVSTRFHQITEGQPYQYGLHGEMIVVEPGDTVADLEREGGCAVLENPFDNTRFGDSDFVPIFECLEEHPGCYEIVIIFSDTGAGVLMFVPKQPGVDPELLAMCAAHSQPEQS